MAELMKSLEINVSNEKGIDKKTGRSFEYTRHYVEVNKVKVTIVPKGSTAWEVFLDRISQGIKFSLCYELKEIEQQDGTIKGFDSLYIDVDGDHLPITTKDSYGKTLVMKFFKS